MRTVRPSLLGSRWKGLRFPSIRSGDGAETFLPHTPLKNLRTRPILTTQYRCASTWPPTVFTLLN
eukprot:4646615-Karenia_brevis.AAC.1